MYKIKQVPEDFFVKEISGIEPGDKGRFCYFILKKRNYTTLRALEHIAQSLKIDVKRFGFAGAKDKHALTEQLVSVSDISEEKLKRIKLKDIEIIPTGYRDKPLSLGELKGNSFRIIVRNLDDTTDINPKYNIPNYFGEQRFSKNNHLVGKAIIKKEFKRAVELILENKGDNEYKVKEHLEKKPNDFIGALRTLHKKILKLYVHSFQSYLFNRCADELIRTKEKNLKIPIVGFGTELEKNQIGDRITKLLKEEQVVQRDFIIPQIPELSTEGDFRCLYIRLMDLKISPAKEDIFNPGKKAIEVSFSLPKGSYATVAIKECIKLQAQDSI